MSDPNAPQPWETPPLRKRGEPRVWPLMACRLCGAIFQPKDTEASQQKGRPATLYCSRRHQMLAFNAEHPRIYKPLGLPELRAMWKKLKPRDDAHWKQESRRLTDRAERKMRKKRYLEKLRREAGRLPPVVP